MDRHVRRLLNRISLLFAFVATISLFHLFHHSSTSCFPSPSPPSHSPTQTLTLTLSSFPKSSCDAFSRRVLPFDQHFAKLRSSPAFRRRSSAASTAVFSPLRSLALLGNSSRVLVTAAGAGHEVDALKSSGVVDVTGVDLVDFPPLVRRADPHSLPFFDGVFDIAFTSGFATALFPTRFAGEMERTVRKGGAVVVAIERRWEVEGIARLFGRSIVLEVRDVALYGMPINLIIMRNNGTSLH